jgi:sugar phosphate isomerase/epimerase
MQFGCFNRPWAGCELARTLDGIAGAGFEYCGLLRYNRRPILAAASPPEETASVLQMMEERGLKVRCNLVSIAMDLPRDAAIENLQAEILAAHRAGVPHLLTTGVTDPARYEHFLAVLEAAAPIAARHGVTLGLKPHGGISATNKDCVAAVERIARDGFGIWYDPGNIIHYTGTSPEADLALVAPFVVGMCVKDCAGGLGGSVTITPGDGEVNFPEVFRLLIKGGFNGPALVECLGGATPAEVDLEAKRVHASLRQWTENAC